MKKKIAVLAIVEMIYLSCIGGLMYLVVDHGKTYIAMLNNKKLYPDLATWRAMLGSVATTNARIAFICLVCAVVLFITAIFILSKLIKTIKLTRKIGKERDNETR